MVIEQACKVYVRARGQVQGRLGMALEHKGQGDEIPNSLNDLEEAKASGML